MCAIINFNFIKRTISKDDILMEVHISIKCTSLNKWHFNPLFTKRSTRYCLERFIITAAISVRTGTYYTSHWHQSECDVLAQFRFNLKKMKMILREKHIPLNNSTLKASYYTLWFGEHSLVSILNKCRGRQ